MSSKSKTPHRIENMALDAGVLNRPELLRRNSISELSTSASEGSHSAWEEISSDDNRRARVPVERIVEGEIHNVDSWRTAPDHEEERGAFWQGIEKKRDDLVVVQPIQNGQRGEATAHGQQKQVRSATHAAVEDEERKSGIPTKAHSAPFSRNRSGRRLQIPLQQPKPIHQRSKERAFVDRPLLDRLTLTGGVKAERQLLRFQVERRELREAMVREAEAILAQDRKYRLLITKAVENQGSTVVSDYAAKVRMMRNKAAKVIADREAFNSTLRPTYGAHGAGQGKTA